MVTVFLVLITHVCMNSAFLTCVDITTVMFSSALYGILSPYSVILM